MFNRTHQDHRGIDLQPGQIVAYNWSGAIAVGEILSVTNSAITIKQTTPGRQAKPSKVKDSHSVLVLFEHRDNHPCTECDATPLLFHNVGCSRAG